MAAKVATPLPSRPDARADLMGADLGFAVVAMMGSDTQEDRGEVTFPEAAPLLRRFRVAINPIARNLAQELIGLLLFVERLLE